MTTQVAVKPIGTTMSFASVVKAPPRVDTMKLRTLCNNSDYSERLAFEFLGFKPKDQIASERALSALFPNRKVPDAIFKSKCGNFERSSKYYWIRKSY